MAAANPRPTAGPLVFAGFAIACVGGPLALVTLLPGTIGDAGSSAGLVVLLALAVFVAPLGIWVAWSRDVVSPGGLSAFVSRAAGRRVALVHGWIWSFAYFLYLPYTVTFVVYDLLPPVFPGIAPYRAALELLLPVALVGVALAPARAVLAALAGLAAVQIAVLVALGVVELSHTPAAFPGHAEAADVGRGTGGAALLFVCLSLPLYLGAEVRGAGRTVRRALPAALAVVGASLLLASLPLATVPEPLRDAAVPGAAIAQAYGGRGFGVAVGVLTALSTLALIVAEYLALSRLVHWLHGFPVRSVLMWTAVPFVVADAISLADPDRFYDDLLKPSLGALFVAQLAVFVLFPRVRPNVPALVAAAVASSLAVWGLYTLLAGTAST